MHYATGESLPICRDSLFCLLFLPDWSVDFVFSDSTNASAIFWADSFQVDILTDLNPSSYAPLNAQMEISSNLIAILISKL